MDDREFVELVMPIILASVIAIAVMMILVGFGMPKLASFGVTILTWVVSWVSFVRLGGDHG